MKRFLLSLALIAGLSVAVPPTATATPTPNIEFTILGPTTTPDWVTFVIDLKYFSSSSSESLTVTYELKGSSATQLAYLRCSHGECYPRQVEATATYSPGSITIKPNLSTSSAVSAYIKIQICDLKSACTENLSPGIYQVGITVRDWLGNQKYLEVNPNVPTPVPTLSPTDLACREKFTALNNKNKLIENNLSSWRSLWTNNTELESFMKSKGLTLASTYSYYLELIGEQNSYAKSNNQLLLDIKLECSINSIYGEWSSAFQYSSNVVNFAVETRNYVYLKHEAKAAEELRQKQEAEAKAAAELKAKQEAEAAIAAELKAKQEAEAAIAADLKAKQEAEARAAADAAILKLQMDEFNEISAAYKDMMNKIVAMKLTFPFTSSLLGMESKMKKLTITLGEDLTTARTNIKNVNKWLDANKKVWAETQKMVITCVKGKLTKKVTSVKPRCPVGYKVKK